WPPFAAEGAPAGRCSLRVRDESLTPGAIRSRSCVVSGSAGSGGSRMASLAGSSRSMPPMRCARARIAWASAAPVPVAAGALSAARRMLCASSSIEWPWLAARTCRARIRPWRSYPCTMQRDELACEQQESAAFAALSGHASRRALLHVELAGAHHAAVLRDLHAVAAGGPAVGLADVEVGGLGAGGDVLGFFGDGLVAVEVGPPGGQAAGVAVAGDRGVDGVAAGEAGERGGDAVIGVDRVAQGHGGGGDRRRQHRGGRGGHGFGRGARGRGRDGFVAAAADEGDGADGGGKQGLGQAGTVPGGVLVLGGSGGNQAAAGGGALPSPSSSISGSVITCPGKMRSGLSMVSRLASKIFCHRLALP